MNAPFLPRKKADVTAAAPDRANWTRADYVAEARERQRGAGFASPFLSVTDEQLAQADADISWRLHRARNKRPDPYFVEAFK